MTSGRLGLRTRRSQLPKTRIEVATDVQQAFHLAEQAVEASAAALARCTAILIEARGRAKLPPLAGSKMLALMAQGTQNAINARQQVLEAHPLLAELGRDIGVLAYGPSEECTPNQPFVGATTPLRVVG